MSIDRRITNGLAWAGAILVVGIPTADLLSAQFMGNPSDPVPAQVAVIEPIAPIPAPLSQRPDAPVAKPAAEVAAVVAPVKPATTPAAVTKPAATPAAQTADAVDAFLQSGRKLPSYITGADVAAPTEVAVTPPARTPIVTTPPVAPTTIDPVEVAAIAPQKVAPVPMPLSMRPRPVVVVAPPVVVIPPSVGLPPANVTAADLADWESGPLSEFLARRQGGNAYVDPGYDPNGFYLDEGPNRSRARVIAREVDSFFFAD
ncbi:hypothetical protein [Devosia ginsengisoli]|uniref:hypothetical protein n=1 Tax=Devosia ginsengisoli TaxID=400770 RepID=UPI0026E9826E|nr:hypothetical protein [Devosia ginsengisoli]MCR6673887.1 hypothetical protein [Devosia ginsengisoli]